MSSSNDGPSTPTFSNPRLIDYGGRGDRKNANPNDDDENYEMFGSGHGEAAIHMNL